MVSSRCCSVKIEHLLIFFKWVTLRVHRKIAEYFIAEIKVKKLFKETTVIARKLGFQYQAFKKKIHAGKSDKVKFFLYDRVNVANFPCTIFIIFLWVWKRSENFWAAKKWIEKNLQSVEKEMDRVEYFTSKILGLEIWKISNGQFLLNFLWMRLDALHVGVHTEQIN